MSEKPQLSVVIVVAGNAQHLKSSLSALQEQQNPPVMEVIVPYLARDSEIPLLKEQFAHVRFHPVAKLRTASNSEIPGHEHLAEMRAIGLSVAEGEIVALTEDYARVSPTWARSVWEAHRESYPAIGGAIENEVDSPLNWAIYFCDFTRYQTPLKNGPSRFLSDVNVSYKREALESIRSVWESEYQESAIHDALRVKGGLWIRPEILVYEHRGKLDLSAALRERYEWGRAYGAFRVNRDGVVTRWLLRLLSPCLPLLLMIRKIHAIVSKKRLIRQFVRAFPFTALLTTVWSFGEFVGYWTGTPRKKRTKK